jgi:hypothetical protein
MFKCKVYAAKLWKSLQASSQTEKASAFGCGHRFATFGHCRCCAASWRLSMRVGFGVGTVGRPSSGMPVGEDGQEHEEY